MSSVTPTVASLKPKAAFGKRATVARFSGSAQTVASRHLRLHRWSSQAGGAAGWPPRVTGRIAAPHGFVCA